MEHLDGVSELMYYDGPLIYWGSKEGKQYLVFFVDEEGEGKEYKRIFFAFEVNKPSGYYNVLIASKEEWNLLDMVSELKKGFVVIEDSSKDTSLFCWDCCCGDNCKVEKKYDVNEEGISVVKDFFIIKKELIGEEIPEEYFPGK